MPFLAPLLPALLAGGASAVGGMAASSLLGGGSAGQTPQAPGVQQPVSNEAATNAFNTAGGAVNQNQAFVNQLQGMNGTQNLSNVYGQLGQVAAGQGPNPAQAMLSQATGQNVANQGAMAAGQRGAGANVGMIARQAGQIGAGTQQNAAGQAATMQANQSLNALGQMGNIAQGQVGAQQAGMNAFTQAAQNQANMGLGAVNQANTIAANQYGTAAGMTNATRPGQAQLGNIIGGGVSTLAGAIPGMMQSPNPNAVNPATGNPNWSGEQTHMGMAHGGEVADGPQSHMGKFLYAAHKMANGGKVPAMLSPGEEYLTPSKARMVAKGKANPLAIGERIQGKAKVAGDSLKNDTVPKTLDVGGVVVPRSKADDPVKAAKFVAATVARKKHGKRK
jgi:hypothetical protein